MQVHPVIIGVALAIPAAKKAATATGGVIKDIIWCNSEDVQN